MNTSEVVYLGELRTKAVHLRSGEEVITDAPPDNQGRGEYFSPTDLVATALGSCMLTLMGIAARTHQINMDGTRVEVKKIMAENPRRISKIEAVIHMSNRTLTDKEKSILERAALTCPVSQSLHPDLVQDVQFVW